MRVVLYNSNKEKCRLCLQKAYVGYTIDEDIVKLIQSITSITVNIDDPIFNIICLKCNMELRMVDKLLNKFREANDRFLRGVFHETKEAINPEISNENVRFLRGDFYEVNEPINPEKQNEDEAIKLEIVDEDLPSVENVIKDEVSELPNESENPNNEEEEEESEEEEGEGGIFKCKTCAKEFPDKYSLKRHKANHVRAECKICHKSVTRCNLRNHMVTHNPEPVVCKICGKKSRNKITLRKHMEFVHGEGDTCEYCGKKYPTRCRLKLHIAKDHLKNAKQFICEKCGKAFFDNYKLKLHILRTHENQRLYVCQYCNKKFSACGSLRTHERQHTNNLPYECEVCGAKFRQNISLRTHRKSKHNIVEELICPCTICPDRAFPSQFALNSHMHKMHHTNMILGDAS